MTDTINKIKDSIEITAINGGAVIISTMSQVEQVLRILSLLFAIAYTISRLYGLWERRVKKRKNK